MKALVTGATGFVGSHLTEALRRRGDEVTVLARSAAKASKLSPLEVRVVPGNLHDAQALSRAVEGQDVIYHVAGVIAARSEADFFRSNRDGTAQLAKAAEGGGGPRFVLVSSMAAAGPSRRGCPLVGTEPARPVTAYGRSKLAAEQAVRAAANRHGLHAPILRLPLAYGPWMKANALTLFDLVERGTPLPLERVDNRRSLVYVGNFVAAVQAVVEREAGNDLFFVSDGPPVSTPELIRAIARALDRPARLVPVPVGLMRAAGRAGDLLARVAPWRLTSVNLERMIGSLAVDSSKLAAVAGPPPFTLAAGLAATARWYRARSGT
jgi:nucleoside-diphosphate-sugar epimerase